MSKKAMRPGESVVDPHPMARRSTPSAPRGAQASSVAPGEILFHTDRKTQFQCVIVIDAVVPGPALGGCSLVASGNAPDALDVALHRARSTTRQAVLADLPCGGGHAVLVMPDRPFKRAPLYGSFCESVRLTKGRFLAIEGEFCVATALPRHRQLPPTSLKASHDGSGTLGWVAASALGIFLSLEEGLRRDGIAVRGATVAMHGLGAIAFALAQRLREAGARLVVADSVPERAREASRLFDAKIVGEAAILGTPCDALAPCSNVVSAILHPATKIAAALVCGTAADPLFDVLDEGHALWLPDDLVASGGLVAASARLLPPTLRDESMSAILRIGERVQEFMDRRKERSSKSVIEAWISDKLAARPAWPGWTTIMR